jgi:ketosteroid isomerase-like protein
MRKKSRLLGPDDGSSASHSGTTGISNRIIERGAVGAVLDHVTDDVDWATETSSTVAPWYGVRRGKDGVGAFFAAFGSTMEVQEFSPFAFAANDTEVHTVVHCRATARTTGKSIDNDLHHFFRFHDRKISYYRGTEDTAQTEDALKS